MATASRDNVFSKFLTVALFGLLFALSASFAAAPSVSPDSPADNAQTSDVDPDFSFTATDDTNVTFTCTLAIDGASCGINESTQNDTQTTITSNCSLGLGPHSWNVSCTDEEGTGVSSTRTIEITGCVGASANFTAGTSITENCTVNGNMSGVSGVLLRVGADGIVINCADYTLSGGSVAVYNAPGYDNVVVQNCVMSGQSAAGIQWGDGSNDANGGAILNNVITLSSATSEIPAIVLYRQSSHNLVQNNTISIASGAATDARGIYIRDSSATNNSIMHNNIQCAGRNDRVGIRLYNNPVGNYMFDNTVTGCYNGIQLTQAVTFNVVENNTLINNSNGVMVETSANNNTIIGNNASFSESPATGIAIYSSAGTLISGNILESNSGSGITLSSASANNVSNNDILNNDQYGIYSSGSSSNVIDNNYLFNNSALWDYSAILLDASSSNVLTNNEIADTVGLGAATGIYVTGSSDSMLISNEIYGSSAVGIRMVDANRTNITGDHYFGNGVDLNASQTTGNVALLLNGVVFDNPAGDFTNYTNLSLADIINGSGGGYNISWAAQPEPAPANTVQFADKFVEISGFSGPGPLDNVTWHYTDAELTGYNESNFAIFSHSASNNWSYVASVRDTAANSISAYNMPPASVYGIFEANDTTAPSIALNSPAGGSSTDSANVTINFTVTDAESASLSCTSYLDGSPDVMGMNVNNNTAFTASSTWSEGFHTWYVNCSDFGGNSNVSETWNLTVDLTAPVLVLNAPPSGNLTADPNVTMNFTVVDNLDPSISCTLDENAGTLGTFNVSNGTERIDTYEYTDGIHFWNVTCTDDAGNSNTSETRNFTVDSIAPEVTNLAIAEPANTTYPLNISANVSDATTNVTSVLAEISCPGDNPLNVTMNPLGGTAYNSYEYTPFYEGNCTVRIYAADLIGNVNGTETDSVIVSAAMRMLESGDSITLTQDVNCTGVAPWCFWVGDAENVTFDCDGYQIFSDSGPAFGVNNSANITFLNCDLSGFNMGFMVQFSDGISILDTTITGGTNGIEGLCVGVSTFAGITFAGQSQLPMRIGCDIPVSDNLIENNTYGNSSTCLYISDDNNTVRGNLFDNCSTAIHINGSAAFNNTLDDNVITGSSTGVLVQNAPDNTITGLDASALYGVRIEGSSAGTRIEYSSISASSYGALIYSNGITVLSTNFTGSGAGYAIGAYGNNTEITDCIIGGFSYGIEFGSVTGGLADGNSISDSYGAITLSGNSLVISGNTITNSTEGIWVVGGGSGTEAYDNNITDNVLESALNGRPLNLNWARDNRFERNNVSNCWDSGVVMRNSHSNLFSGNRIDSNPTGVWFDPSNPSENNTFQSNNISGNFGNGIEINAGCSGNSVIGNTLSGNNYDGVYAAFADRTEVSGNNLTLNSQGGVEISDSFDVQVQGNNASGNGDDGIRLYNVTVVGDVRDNTANGNGDAYGDYGIDVEYSPGLNYVNNTANSNYDQGISVQYSAGSSLISNTADSNTQNNGIYLGYSENSEITGCTASSNNNNGIALYQSPGTLVNESDAMDNLGDAGIYIGDSENCTLTGNDASSNDNGRGIYVASSPSATLSDNTADSNYARGISCYQSNSCTLVRNNASSNGMDGIHIEESDGCTVQGSYVSSNTLVGINVTDSENAILVDNTADSNAIGIYADPSPNAWIENNTASSNAQGITVEDSDNATITGNRVTFSGTDGIVLLNSTYAAVTGNNVTSGSGIGLRTDGAPNATIEANNISGNTGNGMDLSLSGDALIQGNIVNSNSIGIGIADSGSSELYDNEVDSNSLEGIYVDPSPDCVLMRNNVTRNNHGIYVWSSPSITIDSNNVSDNNNLGIYLWNSENGTITDNLAINNTGSQGIGIDDSANAQILGNTVEDNGDGIDVDNSPDSEIRDNTANSNSGNGITLDESNDCTAANNTASWNDAYGIIIAGASGNTLTNNTANGNSNDGFYLTYANDNTLTDNTADLNEVGFGLTYAGRNALTNCDAANNTNQGLEIRYDMQLDGAEVDDFGNYSLRDDDAGITYLLPFEFPFMNRTITRVSVNTNGLIELLEDGEDCYECDDYGTHGDGDHVGNMDALFASNDDLQTDDEDGSYLGIFNRGTHMLFEWNGSTYDDYDSDGYPTHFQVLMYPNGTVQWNFKVMNFSSFGYDMFTGAYANEEDTEFEAGYEIDNRSSYRFDFNLSGVPANTTIPQVTYSFVNMAQPAESLAQNTVQDGDYADNGADGAYLYSTGANTISDNRMSQNGAAGIAVEGDSTDNTLRNNTITMAGASAGIAIYDGPSANRFIAHTLSGSAEYAFAFGGTAANNTIYNSTVQNFTPTRSANVLANGTSNNSFVNTTFNRSDAEIYDSAMIWVYWYLNALVQDTGGNAIEGADVTITDDNNHDVYVGATDSDGLTGTFEALEYSQDSSQTYATADFYTPHEAEASASGYNTNTASDTVDESKTITVQLSKKSTFSGGGGVPLPKNGTNVTDCRTTGCAAGYECVEVNGAYSCEQVSAPPPETQSVGVPGGVQNDTGIYAVGATGFFGGAGLTLNGSEVDSLPAGIPPLEGVVVHSYLSLGIGVPPENVTNATILFKVSKEWVIENGVDPATIALYRFSGGAWVKLPTTMIAEDATYYYYEATSPGFSYFAIAGAPITVLPPETCLTAGCASGFQCKQVNGQYACVKVTPSQPPQQPPVQPPAEPGFDWVGAIITAAAALLIIGAVAYVLMLAAKGKPKEEPPATRFRK